MVTCNAFGRGLQRVKLSQAGVEVGHTYRMANKAELVQPALFPSLKFLH